MSQEPQVLIELHARIAKVKHKKRVDEYFQNLGKIQTAIRNGDMRSAKLHAHASWGYLGDLILSETLGNVLHSERLLDRVFKRELRSQEIEDVALDLLKTDYPGLDANTRVPGKSDFVKEIELIEGIVDYYPDLYRWERSRRKDEIELHSGAANYGYRPYSSGSAAV